MRQFLSELNKRSSTSYWSGILFLLLFFICLGFTIFSRVYVEGVNVWLQPAKYFLSSFVTLWSLSWMVHYIQSKQIKNTFYFLFNFSLWAICFFVFISAIRKKSVFYDHINPFDHIVYQSLIGCFVLFFLLVTAFNFILFNQRKMPISQHYTWGIRMGILVFNFFLLIGFLMLNAGGHVVGNDDRDIGIFFLNWSLNHGDLRISLFLGMHALQIIPLLSYYVFTKKVQVINFTLTYIAVVLALFILAMMGISLFGK